MFAVAATSSIRVLISSVCCRHCCCCCILCFFFISLSTFIYYMFTFVGLSCSPLSLYLLFVVYFTRFNVCLLCVSHSVLLGRGIFYSFIWEKKQQQKHKPYIETSKIEKERNKHRSTNGPKKLSERIHGDMEKEEQLQQNYNNYKTFFFFFSKYILQ